MSIKYYPNRIYKSRVPAIDREMAQRNTKLVKGSQNITSTAIDETISVGGDWTVNSIAWTFSNATSRNFSALLKNGRGVVANLNDYLWFQTPTTSPQRIILDADFYTGTELAAHLKTKLDANVAFAALGITFTVAYVNLTGLFTITPSSGTVKYLNTNPAQTLRTTDSIAGHLFGFEADTAFAASITSDTAVKALDSETAVVNVTASVALDYAHTDIHPMEVDQALHLTSNTASVAVDWTVNYEEIT